ncbi:MAG: AI-2E family transporter [Veillonellaceae bacterium]|nr:AI-2E family transporter [Veillonellaceae bacterium]
MVKKDTQFWLRIAIVAAICLLIYYVPWIVVPFILALFLCLVLRPLVNAIMRWTRYRNRHWVPIDLAIILSFIIFILVLVLIGNSIIVPFVHEFELFILQVPEMADQAVQLADYLQRNYFEFIPRDVQTVLSDLAVRAGNYLAELAKNGIFAIWAFTSTLIELVVVPIITFYMLKNGAEFKQLFAGLFPQRYRRHILNVIEETDYMLSAYIRGQLLLCLFMAVTVFIGMYFFGVPYPLVIALLAGLVELVPIVGPIVGAIPPILLAATISPALALKVLVFYIIVQQADGHLLMPKLMGNVIQIHPVAIIAGVLIGSALLGLFGMMLAVPTLAVLKVCAKHMWYYNTYEELAQRQS